MTISAEEYFASLDEDDAPELTEELMAQAKLGRDILPENILAQFPRGRGRPKSATPKRQITLRLDGDLIDFFKATGDGWQSRMNETLRKGAGFTD